MTLLEDLKNLLIEDWNFEMKDNPEFASQAGQHNIVRDDDYALQDISPLGYLHRAKHSRLMVEKVTDIIQEARAKLYRADELEKLSSEEMKELQSGNFSELWKTENIADRLDSNHLLIAEMFKTMHQECESNISTNKLYLLPINSMGVGGVVFSFIESVEMMRFETSDDFEYYLKRLKSFNWQIERFTESLKEGISCGMVASAAVLKDVESQLEDLIHSNLEPLLVPIKATKSTAILSDSLKTDILNGIENTKSSFSRFLHFFRSEYLIKARSDPACSSLPNGQNLYQSCLNFHTNTTLTADQIHRIGLSEVEFIESRYINEVLKPLGFLPDQFDEFIAFVQESPDFYVDSPNALKQSYEAMCEQIREILPYYFDTFPKSPLVIETRTAGPAAYYLAGTADGNRPGRFYVNVGNIREKPMYEIPSLALHEAIPVKGHHHQISLALENENLPMFLRCLEDRRYEVCPARRNMYTSYIEGWALYCEYLGEEMRLYKTPYEIFGRLSMDMMRAVRLVVDTGIHALGWSIEKSVDYMVKKTGMSVKEVESEIYRYASWPGQATAYKIGQLEFLRLRRKAERELGDIFCVKQFHSVCLNSGPVTFTILEDMVDKYIARRKEELRILMES